MKPRRGFKTEAKRLALEVRAEADIELFAPLDPWALAHLYGVEVVALNELDCSTEALTYLTTDLRSSFSGAVMRLATGQVIIENPGHALGRRRSTMSHEMSHILLEHEFSPTLLDERGCRASDPLQEVEAAELSGELLIPFEGARRLARRGLSDDEVATTYGVSVAFAAWRMNGTGARKIASRQADAYLRKVNGSNS